MWSSSVYVIIICIWNQWSISDGTVHSEELLCWLCYWGDIFIDLAFNILHHLIYRSSNDLERLGTTLPKERGSIHALSEHISNLGNTIPLRFVMSWASSLRRSIIKMQDFYISPGAILLTWINASPPGQNGRHFPDDNFKCIFVNENSCILIKISQKFVPKGPIDNNQALV